MSLQVIHAQAPAELDLAYRCHHDWYVQAGYLQPQTTGLFRDRFADCADYYLVCAGGQDADYLAPAGATGLVRLIYQHPMPMFIDFELSRLSQVRLFNTEPADFLEISALSWKPGMECVLPYLYRAIWQGAQARNRHWLIASLDKRLLEQVRAHGLPFRVGGESRCYMGSITTPVYFHTEQIASVLPERNPKLWALMQAPVDEAVCI